MGSGESWIHEKGFFCPFSGEISGRHPTRNFLGNGGRRWPSGQLGGLAGGDPSLESGDLGASGNPARSLSEEPSQGTHSWWAESGLGYAGGGRGRGVPLGVDRPFSAGCQRRLPGNPEKTNSTAVHRPLESNGTRGLGHPPWGRGILNAASLSAHGDLSASKEMNLQSLPSPLPGKGRWASCGHK